MSAVEKRAHGRSPWRDAFEAVVGRPERQPTPPECSVTLSRNAKGAIQYEVTVRGSDVFDCEAQALTVEVRLADLYPYPVEATALKAAS